MANICKACGAPLRWFKTPLGKWMPVDPLPVKIVREQYGEEVFVTREGTVIRGRVALAGEQSTDEVFIPHFATCSSADAFRRKGGGKK